MIKTETVKKMKKIFSEPSLLNTRLTLENLQTIHFYALESVISGKSPIDNFPITLSLSDLRKSVHLYGYEACFLNPADIENIFHGVTTDVYKLIETLYCDLIGRPIPIIHKIICALAHDANFPPINYEAIWAICIYLNQHHKRWTVVDKMTLEDSWHIYKYQWAINIQNPEENSFPSQIILVVNDHNEKVLSYSLVSDTDQNENDLLSVLYEALSVQRLPAARHPSGLIWKIPAQINFQMPVSPEIKNLCQNIGIQLALANRNIPEPIQIVLDAIPINRQQSDSHQVNYKTNLHHFIDSYMDRFLDYSPDKDRKNLDEKRRKLIGYNRDPSTILPQLRDLLPEYSSFIRNGAVALNGLHYTNDLLEYWPDQPVTLRISPHAESRCWVYIDGEVLCEARAQELQQRDGSFRDYRNIR